MAPKKLSEYLGPPSRLPPLAGESAEARLVVPKRHSHGPLKVLFCRQCRYARQQGLRYIGRFPKGYRTAGQRIYARDIDE